LVLAPGAATKLRNEIIAATANRPIPINVKVGNVSGGGGRAPSGGVVSGRAPSGGVVSTASKAEAAAKKLTDMEDRLAITLGRVADAERVALRPTTDLTKARDAQAIAGRALSAAVSDLSRAEGLGSKSSISFATATRDQALAAKGLADAQVGLIAAKSRVGVDQSLSLTKQEAAANVQLNKVLAVQTEVVATGNAALAQRAQVLVSEAQGSATSASAAQAQVVATAEQAAASVAAAEAETALGAARARQGPILARQTALQAELTAVQGAAVLSTEAGGIAVANLTRVRAALAASTKLVTDLEREGLTEKAALAAANRLELQVEENLLATRVALAKGSAELAAAEGAAVKPASLLAKARAELAAVQRSITPLEEANERALRTQDVQLQKTTAETLELARAREINARAGVESAPFRTRVGQIEDQLARARNPIVGTSPRELAASANSAAELARRNQLGLIAAIEKGTIAANAEDLKRVQILGIETTRTEQLTAAEVVRLRGLERTAVTQGQVTRGAAATGATFLGLRGAVLSSSGGFLLATVAVTGLAKVVGSASQLQQSFNTFQAVTGATANQMARGASLVPSKGTRSRLESPGPVGQRRGGGDDRTIEGRSIGRGFTCCLEGGSPTFDGGQHLRRRSGQVGGHAAECLRARGNTVRAGRQPLGRRFNSGPG